MSRDLITPHFRWSEVAYLHYDDTYTPDDAARRMIRLTCQLILEPLREHMGAPIYILPGGGYDPLRDADDVWISHRTSETTQHHHGGALDFRVGVSSAQAWDMGAALEWVDARLETLGIPGGLGVYLGAGNRFLHVDLRSPRARWEG